MTIDWREAEALVGGNKQTARELMALLIERLPDDLQQMDAAWQQSDREALYQLVHRFYGGLCYCGVPQLRQVAGQLKTLCQSDCDDHAIADQLGRLTQAVSVLLKAYSAESSSR